MSDPNKFSAELSGYIQQLDDEATNGSSQVSSAVHAFVADLRAAGNGNVNIGKLSSDANKISSTCSRVSASTSTSMTS